MEIPSWQIVPTEADRSNAVNFSRDFYPEVLKYVCEREVPKLC